MNGKFILIILVLGMLSLSIVSAEDNVTDVVSIDNHSDTLEISEEIPKDESPHSGYWVLSKDRDNLDLDDLSKQGVTDVFLNFKSYEVYGKDNLESWIANASEKGISTHIWTQIFWTSKTGWILPVVNGTQNDAFFNEKIAELDTYASLKGLKGIHMDYLRYSGSTQSGDEGKQAITNFVIKATASIRQINPNLTISAALMPNMDSLINVYGVDYPQISRYFDVIIPMIYSSSFKKDRNWIVSTTKTFIENSKSAVIWAGLQSYVNDNDLTHLSIARMNGDIKAAMDAGAAGTIIFRFGVSENINFHDAFALTINVNANSASFNVMKGGNYQISLKDAKGNPVPSENVVFLLNGKKIAAAISDSKGIVKFKLTSKILKSVKTGKNALKIKLCNGKINTVKINIKKDTPKLKVKKYKKKLKIILKSSTNKAIKKAKITIKINGKTKKVKTNSKGKATFKISGKGKMTIRYCGNRYYKSVSKKIK